MEVECTCKLKHVGLGGNVSETNRIHLNNILINTANPTTYNLINDSLIIHIPSKQSASFSFSYNVTRPKDGLEPCTADLNVSYIDPITGDLDHFSSLILDDEDLNRTNQK